MDRRNADLPAIIYLGLVIVLLVVQIGVRLLDPSLEVYKSIFNGEMGFIELGTAALLLSACVLLAPDARRLSRHGEYMHRSEERRVGKEGDSTGRDRWCSEH